MVVSVRVCVFVRTIARRCSFSSDQKAAMTMRTFDCKCDPSRDHLLWNLTLVSCMYWANESGCSRFFTKKLPISHLKLSGPHLPRTNGCLAVVSRLFQATPLLLEPSTNIYLYQYMIQGYILSFLGWWIGQMPCEISYLVHRSALINMHDYQLL